MELNLSSAIHYTHSARFCALEAQYTSAEKSSTADTRPLHSPYCVNDALSELRAAASCFLPAFSFNLISISFINFPSMSAPVVHMALMRLWRAVASIAVGQSTYVYERVDRGQFYCISESFY